MLQEVFVYGLSVKILVFEKKEKLRKYHAAMINLSKGFNFTSQTYVGISYCSTTGLSPILFALK